MTAALNLNGKSVLAGTLRMPRVGAWVAELTINATDAPTNPLTITNLDGTLSLVGRIERADVFADTVRVLAVAGRGDLEVALDAKSYRTVPAKLPLQDVLDGAGETLAASADAGALATSLRHWARREGPASLALGNLVEKVGCTWRFLPSGDLWIGADTWPAAPETQHTVVDRDTARDRATLAVETPRLFPATTFEGRRISLVVHEVSAGGITTELWFEEEPEEGADPLAGSRLFESLARLVRKVFKRVDYLGPKACKVIAQNADGTLELKPDDARIDGLSHVPIRVGMPGVKVKVAAGARCYVEFEDGDPSKPIARGWEPDGMTELQIGGAAPIMRQGDMVSTSIPPGFTFTATQVGLISALPGNPVTGIAQFTVIAAPVPLAGIGVTGSGRAKG